MCVHMGHRRARPAPGRPANRSRLHSPGAEYGHGSVACEHEDVQQDSRRASRTGFEPHPLVQVLSFIRIQDLT